MSRLFEKMQINSMELSNRFVRSATWDGMATESGAVTTRMIEGMKGLAEGGVGLIISGHAYVSPEGQASGWQIGIHRDELFGGLREMTDAVHACGGKIVMQLSHAGNFAPRSITGKSPLVVSMFDGLSRSPRREISVRDIHEIVDAFAFGAQRARAAGFDGVQLHCAHGYLLSQFLSPFFNRRQDEYGGGIHNRVRIHLEIYHAVRKMVGKAYPVLIKINANDFIENGLNQEDSLLAAGQMVDAGLDAIELSGGCLTSGNLSPSRTGIDSQDKEAYFQQEARFFKDQIKAPVILVGGVRSFEVADRLVEDGTADYISMSRPFIREAGLINRWKKGDLRRAGCISGNLCFLPGLQGKGICCMAEKRTSGSPQI
ncbi:MAG: NADH:flavin oxidoreductase [Thermodesulfobacteriota bacterium]|nr:NADH:flavin oxidoreductase [Thermodesulfobacteriota bacterium]